MALGNGAFTTLDNQVVIGNTSVTQTLLNGNVGIGITAPTALLNLKAGTATAGTAPIKLTSGVLLTAPEAGAVEFLTDAYYATITTDAARKTFAFLESPTFTGTPSLPTGTTGVTQSANDNSTKIATTAYVEPYGNQSLYRQAIINGNFDVWQRGTSFTDGATLIYTADRFQTRRDAGIAGLTTSRQTASLVGSKYCIRVQRNNGDTSIAGMYLFYTNESVNSIPFAGLNATLSFYARKGANYSATSDLLNANLITGTGTDQNLSAGFTGSSTIATNNFTLTTSWQKFTLTGAVASNVSEIGFYVGNALIGTAGAADYYEIAQVQLNAGSVALPFQPKSYAEELRDCQRYYEKSYTTGVAPGTATSDGIIAFIAFDAYVPYYGTTRFHVTKRAIPTMTVYSDVSGTAGKYYYQNGTADINGSTTNINTESFNLIASNTMVAGSYYRLQWTASSEL